MFAAALASLVLAAPAAAPVWDCRNQLEVWCAADGCAATPPNEFTPMAIRADARKGATVCAYTGCWETKRRARANHGRLLWTAEAVPFSTASNGAMTADVTLLIVEKDGVGFVRVGGLATPLLCTRAK